MDEKTLTKTIRRAQRGDDSAFASLVREYERAVRGFVAARSLPEIEVDEIAQRVFVVAFQRLGQFEAGTNFVAWLLSIARFEILAEQTRLKRQADYHTRYVPFALAQELERRNELSLETADDLAESKLVYLQECLEAMDSKPRQIIDWRYREDTPLAQIANRTGRTVGAIKKHLHVLRNQLHECIERKLATEIES